MRWIVEAESLEDMLNDNYSFGRELIQCKNCRYWENKHLCKAHSIYGTYDTKGSDFCSRAEKREDE